MFKNLKSFHYDVTDSTNLRAREYINNNGVLPAIFVAKEQTKGRGRQGKNFYSPKNTGLYFSLALEWQDSFNTVSLTTAVSVALFRTLKDFTDKSLSIKWVNDILADGKKVAGILCEMVADKETGNPKAVVIGIGVNLSTKAFPEELKDIATALSNQVTDSEKLEKRLTIELYSVIFKESKASVMNEYRKQSAVMGQDIYYIQNGKRFDAVVVAIDENGGLEVEHSDGTKATLTSGEITLRIK